MQEQKFSFNKAANFTKYEQILLNLFAFLIAWPPIKIGVNLSFFVFVFLITSLISRKINPIKIRVNYQRLFQWFLILGVFTTLLKQPEDLIREQFFNDFLLLFNFAYWIVLSIFIITNRNKINLFTFSKYYFYGSIFLIIFYFLPGLPSVSNPLIQFPVVKGRNVLVYQLLNIIPIAFMYVASTRSKTNTVFIILLYLLIMLLSNGRAGSIILFIVTILLFLLLFSKYSRLFKNIFALLFFSFIIIFNDDDAIYINAIAKPFEKISPRVADMIKQEGNGVANNDKSWLIRELMVEKGLMIVNKHPIFGIGFNRFRNYQVNFDGVLSTQFKFDRLGVYSSDSYLNNKSPHNSYIQILAENGIVGLILFLIMLFYPLKFFFVRFYKNQLTFDDAPIVALFGLTIYLYVISSYPTAITFVTIALAYNATKIKRS